MNSYGQMNVTMIDQLPELDDMDVGNNFPPHGAGLPPEADQKYQKYIRPSHHMSPESGMMNMTQYNQHAPPQEFQQQQLPEVVHSVQFNCIDIANHIQGCPICSRFYNNDKTVYVIAIVVLSIICLLLMKRVLNV